MVNFMIGGYIDWRQTGNYIEDTYATDFFPECDIPRGTREGAILTVQVNRYRKNFYYKKKMHRALRLHVLHLRIEL